MIESMHEKHKAGFDGILESLRHAGFLSGFHLSLFRRAGGESEKTVPHWESSAGTDIHPLFGMMGEPFLSDVMERAVQACSTQVSRSRLGLYCFAVPVFDGDSQACIAGCGVRDSVIDLVTVEKCARDTETDPVAVLEELDVLPVFSFGAVSEVAARVVELVRILSPEASGERPTLQDTERIRLVGEIASEIDSAETADDTVSLLSESLGMIFDLPGIAIIRSSAGRWNIEPLWGIDFEKSELNETRARSLVSRNNPLQLPPSDLAGFIPAAAGSRGVAFPLRACGRRYGALLLIGERFAAQDILLQDLLAGRGAMRLAVLDREKELVDRNLRSEKMLEIFNRLALLETVTEISRELLDSAAELAGATSGSLMLHDSQRGTLNISAVRGMNPTLARVLTVRVGSGIAGQVAKSGTSILVNDIFNDSRFTVGRRPRFKTGSFMSIPLCWKGDTLAVLNLSDRINNVPFDQSDLDLLSSLAGHAASLIYRARTSEGARHLELLSITDPLTELYNRRFLERRMEEELARSSRHNLKMSVMMLDLDTFKLYNDLCGHQAGDIALKKVADVLRRSVREMDIVTRYGGEEFCILLPDTPKVDAMYVAERIRYGVENELFPGEDGLPLGRITVSIGIASFPENGTSAGDLVAFADMALYQAKGAGRNRIVGSYDMPAGRLIKSFNYAASHQTH